MTPRKNRLADNVLMRGHNIGFMGKYGKLSQNYSCYPFLSARGCSLSNASEYYLQGTTYLEETFRDPVTILYCLMKILKTSKLSFEAFEHYLAGTMNLH